MKSLRKVDIPDYFSPNVEGEVFWNIQVTPELIYEMMEKPYYDKDGTEFVCNSVRLDGIEAVPIISRKDRVNQSTAQRDEGGYVSPVYGPAIIDKRGPL